MKYKFKGLHELTEEERDEIYQYCMDRSNTIVSNILGYDHTEAPKDVREFVLTLATFLSKGAYRMLGVLTTLRNRDPKVVADVLWAWIRSGDPHKAFTACKDCGKVIEVNDPRKRVCGPQENLICYRKRKTLNKRRSRSKQRIEKKR